MKKMNLIELMSAACEHVRDFLHTARVTRVLSADFLGDVLLLISPSTLPRCTSPVTSICFECDVICDKEFHK